MTAAKPPLTEATSKKADGGKKNTVITAHSSLSRREIMATVFGITFSESSRKG